MFGKPLKIAVGVLLAGAALTACAPAKPGAAALVGGGRITVGTVDAAVAQWAKELPSHPAAQQIVARSQAEGGASGTQVPFDPASPRRTALFMLVSIQVWDEAARADGLSVASGQIDAVVARFGGRATLDAYTLAQGLPTSYSRDFARTVLIRQTMMLRYLLPGGTPKSVDAQAQQQAALRLRSTYQNAGHHLNLRINPRFGSFDYQQMLLSPVCPALSSPDSGTSNAAGGTTCQL